MYLANGQPGTGTLVVSWPSFTTASGQLVAADSTTVTIAPDGFVSVNLAPNQGAIAGGAVLHGGLLPERRHDEHAILGGSGNGAGDSGAGTVAVDAGGTGGSGGEQGVCGSGDREDLSVSGLTVSGGTMTGPLTLCCDPTQPLQAADKHYVDATCRLGGATDWRNDDRAIDERKD